MESELSTMRKVLRALCDDVEARSLQHPYYRGKGGKGARKASEYVAEMLKNVLGLDKLPILDRAYHIVHGKLSRDDHPPRAFVVKCYNFTEK